MRKWWLSIEVTVKDKVKQSTTIKREEEVIRREGIAVWWWASVSVWMLTGLIILIQENLKDEQGQNGREEEFNEGVQAQMKFAQHWSGC